MTPNNVMLDDAASAVLTDYGLARSTDARTGTASVALGTPGYAAPEVYRGVRDDPRSDLYGLGGALYLAATGQAPFASSTPAEALAAQLSGERPSVREVRPDLDPALADLIEALLDPSPERRPAGAVAVLDALEGRVALEPAATTMDLDDLAPATRADVVAPAGSPKPRPSEEPVLAAPNAPAPSSGAWWALPMVAALGIVGLAILLAPFAAGSAIAPWVVGLAGLATVSTVAVATLLLRRPPQEVSPAGEAPGRLPSGPFTVVLKRRAATDAASLAAAVARRAGLPVDALPPVEALSQRKVRLVSGVSREVAEDLAQAAETAGWRAKAVDLTPPGPVGVALQHLWVLIPVVWTAFPFLVATGASPLVLLPLFIGMSIVLPILQDALGPPSVSSSVPLAYRRDVAHQAGGGAAGACDAPIDPSGADLSAGRAGGDPVERRRVAGRPAARAGAGGPGRAGPHGGRARLDAPGPRDRGSGADRGEAAGAGRADPGRRVAAGRSASRHGRHELDRSEARPPGHPAARG